MTLTDCLNDLKARIGPANIATDPQLLVWLNEAYMYMVDEIIQENPDYYTTSDTTNLIANQWEYWMPPNCSAVKKFNVKYSNTWVDVRPLQDITGVPILADPNQFPLNTEIDPRYYLTGGKIGLVPVPQQNVTNGIKLWFIYIPPELGVNDTPTFNQKYHHLISLGAYANYLDLDDKHQAAEVIRNRFEQRVQEMVDSISENQIEEPRSIEVVQEGGLYVDEINNSNGVL